MRKINVAKLRADGLNYEGYLELIDQLLEEGKTTGPDQLPERVDKSTLNRQRMKRWDKTAVLDTVLKDKIKRIGRKTGFMVITEGWCGDAAQSLPWMNKMVESNPTMLEAFYVLRDSTDYINDYLTNGSKSIPVLVAFDFNSGDVLRVWGPRPTSISEWLFNLKKSGAMTKDEINYELHQKYAKDKGKAFMSDMSDFIDALI
jgi:hypothetical protein